MVLGLVQLKTKRQYYWQNGGKDLAMQITLYGKQLCMIFVVGKSIGVCLNLVIEDVQRFEMIFFKS